MVACFDYVLSKTPGNTVSNLSSTRALSDVTIKRGGKYYFSGVGEVNVVEKMKKVNAIIGGEGNGGIIYPELHYGRDALLGLALFLSLLAEKQLSVSALKRTYPLYFMSKKKIDLSHGFDVDGLLERMKKNYKNEPTSSVDGLKINFSDSWVHFRKSNTEPIIRIYTEAASKEQADALADRFISELKSIF